MYTLKIKEIQRNYKNEGQHKEQCVRFTLTGKIQKADNTPYYIQGDVGSLQVKSARARICQGLSIQEHINKDAAIEYGYVTNSFMMYVMTKTEYLEFATLFTERTTDRFGTEVLRLKRENQKMIDWLIAQV